MQQWRRPEPSIVADRIRLELARHPRDEKAANDGDRAPPPHSAGPTLKPHFLARAIAWCRQAAVDAYGMVNINWRFNDHVERTNARFDVIEAEIRHLNAIYGKMFDSIADINDKDADIRAILSRLDFSIEKLNGESRITRANLLDLYSRSTGINQTNASKAVAENNNSANDIVYDNFMSLFYTRFEAKYRGTFEEISSRMHVYMPYVAELSSQTTVPAIIDLGCGRGEWLSLLKQSGINATGVDNNMIQLQQAKDNNLDVIHSDVFEYLSSKKDGSIDLITSMHLVEHLEIRDLIRFLREIYRVCKPGGKIILETPNPESLLVGAWKFRLDPTHKNPIPPDLLSTLIDTVGFGDVKILRLSPDPRLEKYAQDEKIGPEIAEILFGPRDYAIIASRPASE